MPPAQRTQIQGIIVNPWLETICVGLIALLGVVAGILFSRLRKSYWMLGYFVPVAVICILVVARCTDTLAFLPPFSWMLGGRTRFVILCLAATIGLTTPLSRLPRKSEQIIIAVMMTIVVFWFSIMPFLVPALIQPQLAAIETKIDARGICYQSTDFTCAPAAAVTILRRLGLTAHEGELAVLSHSSPMAGTLPNCLKAALENRYGSDGLKCQYRRFNSIDQLKEAGFTLAVVKDSFLTDHCVAVLQVSDTGVVLADPVTGTRMLSCQQFESIWRFTGLVLKRDGAWQI